jgi:RNA polymerase sigma factor (sigma-70 family)
MPEVAPPATTAPPADPVRAALADPEVGDRLLALARSILRRPGVLHEDIVQDARLRALANAHKFDPEAGSVTAWLTGFVRNVAREHVKKANRGPTADDALDRLPAPGTGAIDPAEPAEAVRRLLANLRDPLRRAVELRHLEQLDYPAVAAATNTTEATARQRVCRGLLLLRTLATKEASS